jgi:hypothetical protein
MNQWGKNPRTLGLGVFVGYEDYGKTLLYMTSNITEPGRISMEDALPDEWIPGQEACCGWVFVGEKKANPELARIYRDRIIALPRLLTTKTQGYCFGAQAFRAWAKEIERQIRRHEARGI